MKKANILVLKEDQNKLLKSLQRYQVFMPVSLSDNTIGDNVDEQTLQRTEQTIKLLSRYNQKKSLGKVVDFEDFASYNPQREALVEEAEKTKDEIDRLKNENLELQDKINYFSPWQEMDIKLNELENSKYTTLHLGFIYRKDLEKIQEVVNEYGSVLELYGESLDGVASLLINYYQDDQEIISKIKSIGFNEIILPKDNENPRRIITNLEATINNNLSVIQDLERKLQGLSNEIDELAILNDQLLTKLEMKKVKGQETLKALYLEGWIRSDEEDKLKKAIEEATPIYDLEIREPLEDENPPTATKNNRFVEPFEAITNLYSVPQPNELDPNPVMAPWYWLLFGMMVGDVGYGIVMILFFGLLLNILKPKGDTRKLIKTLQYAGIPSIFWGVLYGSYFGATWNPILFVPMDRPLDMLILSMIVGGAHIIFALLVKAYINIRQKNYLDALFDEFTWIMILIGLGFYFLPPLANIGKALIIVGVIVILITGGRKKQNIFGKLTGGITNLFGIANYFSDILSYSRILALYLSSAVVAMVMNMLAGMLQASTIGFFFSIIIYIIGHIFNIAMGLLSAFVHDSRLQYIEFYGKFYEGGGYLYKPLSYKLKYIDSINDKIIGG
ncbi:MAG TPA: V-type ATP synthase subunit I [Acholeplasmataceae bacterium]|nr:V-type ATP synthase subunit I [Acholeplasmataceae bacterium]